MGTEEYLLYKAEKKGFEEGRIEGHEEANINATKNMLADTDFDDAKIASLAGVTPAFVKQLRENPSQLIQ